MRKLSAAFFAILLHEHGTPDSQTLIDSYITHLFELAEGVFGFAVGEHLMPKLKPEMANRVRAAALGGAVLVEVVPAEHRLRSISMTELERMFDFREFKQLPDPRESIVFFTTKSGIAAVKEMEHRKNRVAVNFVDLADQKRSKKEKPTNQVDLFKILSRKQASVDPAAHNDSSSRMRFPEKLRSQSNNSPLAAFTQARAADESTGFQQSTVNVAEEGLSQRAEPNRAPESLSLFHPVSNKASNAPRRSKDSVQYGHESFHNSTCISLAPGSSNAHQNDPGLSHIDLRSKLQHNISKNGYFKTMKMTGMILNCDSDHLDGAVNRSARGGSDESHPNAHNLNISAQCDEIIHNTSLSRTLKTATPRHLRESERVRQIKQKVLPVPACSLGSGQLGVAWEPEERKQSIGLQQLSVRAAFKIKRSVLTLKSLASIDSRPEAALLQPKRKQTNILISKRSATMKFEDLAKRANPDSSPQASPSLEPRGLGSPRRPLQLQSMQCLQSTRASSKGDPRSIVFTRRACSGRPTQKPAVVLFARSGCRGSTVAS